MKTIRQVKTGFHPALKTSAGYPSHPENNAGTHSERFEQGMKNLEEIDTDARKKCTIG